MKPLLLCASLIVLAACSTPDPPNNSYHPSPGGMDGLWANAIAQNGGWYASDSIFIYNGIPTWESEDSLEDRGTSVDTVHERILIEGGVSSIQPSQEVFPADYIPFAYTTSPRPIGPHGQLEEDAVTYSHNATLDTIVVASFYDWTTGDQNTYYHNSRMYIRAK